MVKCEVCEQLVTRGSVFNGRVICRRCIINLSKKTTICPCCGERIQPKHTISIQTLRETKTRKGSAYVCPNCHVLFFDEFHYQILTNEVVS